jgi:hypothetical protein
VTDLGTVKILGLGCPSCEETKRRVFNALAELDVAADVQEVKDPMEIARHGVRFTPAVIVGDEILVEGRVPRPQELTTWFRERALRPAQGK